MYLGEDIAGTVSDDIRISVSVKHMVTEGGT
jgi:hypothetical protein